MRWLIVIALISVQLLTSLCLSAQEEFSVDVLDVRKGLLSNFVTKTISDNKQFKYFATEAGLSRYDGYAFKHYRPTPGSNALPNENIETVFPAKNGYIWIGMKSGGLSRLNLKTQQLENWNDVFEKYTKKPFRIVSITEDNEGNIWIGTWSMGCFKINAPQRKVIEHFPSSRTIHSIICDSKGTVWFTDGRTLCSYSNKDGALKRITQSFNLYHVAEDTARQRIWFVGNNDKLVKLGYFDQLSASISEVPTNIKARFAVSLAIDQQKRIWFGSWGDGLYVSDPSVSRFQKINTSATTGLVENNNHNAILHIYIDPNGIAWLSTSYGGVLILYPNKGFQHLANNQGSGTKDQNVSSIGIDETKSLLVGGISQGLYEIRNTDNPEFVKNPQLPSTRINQVYKKNESLYVGTNDGLFIFKTGLDGPAKRYYSNEKITSILITDNKDLWLGTKEGGLWKMKLSDLPDTANATHYTEFSRPPLQVENDRINRIIEDADGNIWIATYSGLNAWNKKLQRLISHRELFNEKLSGTIIHDMLISGNDIFLATPNGLIKSEKLIIDQGKISLNVKEVYNEEDDLVNQFICALQKDRSGNIWFSSTTGITKLNIHTGVFNHFGKQDGVQINAFHINASFRDESGRIYFGGDNGLVYFNPENVVTSYRQPSMVITGISVNNQPVASTSSDKKKFILNESIQYADNLFLNYNHNNLSVQFSSNDFLGTENISYAYRLEPGVNKWIFLGPKHEVNFNSLNPGTYTLLLRANRNNQGWGQPYTLQLKVAYPPWLSWYAWLIYAVLAAAIIVLIRRLHQRQEKLKTELQRVHFEKEKEHEVNEAKINFFTNISHEFRTPLTLIMSPCTELLSRTDLSTSDTQKISLIKSNAQKLLKLINQLLDFRKSEHGLLKLRTNQFDIRKLVVDLLHDFSPAAKAKNISLNIEGEIDPILMDLDREQMEMAIGNLVGNAIKFTHQNGTVSVSLERGNHFTKILIRDNGIGIESEHINKIFNRFYQVPSNNTNESGSGIGLAFAKNIIELHNGIINAESKPADGTVFSVILPIRQNRFGSKDPVQLRQNDEENEIEVSKSTTGKTLDNRQTVLIIDDNEDIRKYLSDLLQVDYEIIEAVDGSAGLRTALEIMPDMIISDIMMPKMNGIDLCFELKSNMATSHIPVILLTARASEAHELKGLQIGADDYITKPFNPLLVQMRVRNMLDSRKKLKAYYLKKVRFEPETEGIVPENLDEIFLNKAIELVNANLQNESLGIEMMVDHLFMSQSTLYRKIKSLTGLSLTGFIRSIRLKKAAQLILQSNVKLNDVANEVGFNDYKYFKKSFQQQYECLPSEYREKHAQNLQRQNDLNH